MMVAGVRARMTKNRNMNIREAVVAGSFYPGTKSELMDQLNKLLLVEKDKIKSDLAEKEIIGAVIPHAGYIFSGYEAVHFFALLKKSEKQYETIFIINPNHYMMEEHRLSLTRIKLKIPEEKWISEIFNTFQDIELEITNFFHLDFEKNIVNT